MADTYELAQAICTVIQTVPKPVPITLKNQTVEEAAAIIGAVVERCAEDGVTLESIVVDLALAEQLGLRAGQKLPHGGRPKIEVEAGLGRDVLFRKLP